MARKKNSARRRPDTNVSVFSTPSSIEMARATKLAPRRRRPVVPDAAAEPVAAAEPAAAEQALRSRRAPKRGAGVLREIKRYQKNTGLLIPQSRFRRTVRDIAKDIQPEAKFNKLALLALQEGVEYFLCEAFEDANLLACHAKRVTVMLSDLIVLQRLRHDYGYAVEKKEDIKSRKARLRNRNRKKDGHDRASQASD